MTARKVSASVIIPVFNQLRTLKLSLLSLLNQDFSQEFEIIICDDGSSSELFTSLQDVINENPVPIYYVWQQDRSMRVAAARNLGIQLARGEIIIFLDGDIVPNRQLVRKHVEQHDGTGKLLIAGNRLWRDIELSSRCNHLDIDAMLEMLHCSQGGWEKLKRYEENEKAIRDQWSGTPKAWRSCFTCNLSVKKCPEVYFDENFVGYGPEDCELAYRLYFLHGYQAKYCEDIISYHLDGPDNAMNVFRRNKHEEIVQYLRNTFYYFARCPNQPLEDVFFGLPKLELDEASDRWFVRNRPGNDFNLAGHVQFCRQWLERHP